MKIVKPTKAGILQAVKILKNHGVIIYPTDTAYALGGFFNSPKAIKKILQIKKRGDNKFTLVASSLNQVEKFFKLNKTQKDLAKKFWPGPLSLVVSKKFAVRVPKNKIAKDLAKLAGLPLIATSANISGRQTLYDIQKVIKEFQKTKNQPDLIIDSGRLKKIETSTIVSVVKKEIKILRAGAVKI